MMRTKQFSIKHKTPTTSMSYQQTATLSSKHKNSPGTISASQPASYRRIKKMADMAEPTDHGTARYKPHTTDMHASCCMFCKVPHHPPPCPSSGWSLFCSNDTHTHTHTNNNNNQPLWLTRITQV